MVDGPDDILRNKKEDMASTTSPATDQKRRWTMELHQKLDAILNKPAATATTSGPSAVGNDSSEEGDEGEGESAMGSVVGGAVSKGDGDGRMTKRRCPAGHKPRPGGKDERSRKRIAKRVKFNTRPAESGHSRWEEDGPMDSLLR